MKLLHRRLRQARLPTSQETVSFRRPALPPTVKLQQQNNQLKDQLDKLKEQFDKLKEQFDKLKEQLLSQQASGRGQL
jgi:predicted  nucleic acid-binding Zn-ribbon protein